MKIQNWIYYAGSGILAYMLLVAKQTFTRKPVDLDQKLRFIRIMRPIATVIDNGYNIDPVITIAQAGHESAWGTSQLAVEGNNLYGIKSTKSWIDSGRKVWTGNTSEFINGAYETVPAEFRKYDDWIQSATDWARLISTADRYTTLYRYAKSGNVENYGMEVVKAGYAADTYANYRMGMTNAGIFVRQYL